MVSRIVDDGPHPTRLSLKRTLSHPTGCQQPVSMVTVAMRKRKSHTSLTNPTNLES